jgi:hypothetical protein
VAAQSLGRKRPRRACAANAPHCINLMVQREKGKSFFGGSAADFGKDLEYYLE